MAEPTAPQTLSAGATHACALAWDRTAYCWGDDAGGKASPPDDVRFASLAAGNAATCGLRPDGRVTCWGDDPQGMAFAPGHERFVQLEAGASHACGLRADGVAVCWGADDRDQASPPEDGRFVSLSLGQTHTCGLRADGSATCWGAGTGGTPPDHERLVALALWADGCGLRVDGRAACWRAEDSARPWPVPDDVLVAISAGSSHACGLGSFGRPICWGDDEHGQASPPGYVVASIGHELADENRDWPLRDRLSFTSISAGAEYTCGQRADWAVLCWGRDDFGQASPPLAAFTDLPFVEPRYQPGGYALLSRLRTCFWHCDGGIGGVVRTVFREGELVRSDPLAPLAEVGRFHDFDISESRSLMLTSRCVTGHCGGMDWPSEDAVAEFWASRDGGTTWESWGVGEPASRILRVTDDDAAVYEQFRSGSSREIVRQVRWIRSGTVFPAPTGDSSPWIVEWDGEEPVWGEPEVAPAPSALSAFAGWRWAPVQRNPDGSAIWYAVRGGHATLLLAVVDREGRVLDVYGWRSAHYVDDLVPMGDGVFVGFSMRNAHRGLAEGHMLFLVDLGAESVHPLLGFPDGGPWEEPWLAIALGE